MRQLILHIGNHKTGTTAIQLWLEQNAALLAQRGISTLTTPGVAHAHNYLRYVDDNAIFPKGYRIADRTKLTQALKALPGEKVIFSSENLSFFFEGWAVRELAETVLPLFDEVKVICYIRRQDRQAASHHAEGARPGRAPEWQLWGHGQGVLPVQNPMQDLYLDYNARLTKWENVFGTDAMIVRVYERDLLIDKDSVADFCDAAGIDRTGCTAPAEHNTSLSRGKIRIGRLLNTMGTTEAEATQILTSLPQIGRSVKPAVFAARAFVERYRASNEALNKRLKISAHPTLFDTDFSGLPDQPPSTWSDEDYNQTVRALLEMTLAEKRSKPAPEAMVSPDDLREAAKALVAVSPARALRLVQAGLAQRPEGPELLALKDLLEERLAEPKP
jgi:hypothetical protein